MRSSVYVYVLLALPSLLTLAAPLPASERRFVLPPGVPPPIPILAPGVPPPIPILAPGVPPPIPILSPGVPPPIPILSPGVPPPIPILAPGVPPLPPLPPPSPPIIRDPLDGMGPGPVIPPPGKPAVKRAEERREFSHVADQSNQEEPVSPDFGAFRVKRADGALLPVPGQAGHPFFPLPPDLDSPVALPTPILDRAEQGSLPDVLGDFFKAHPNLVFDRGISSTPILDRDDQSGFADSVNNFFEAHPNLVFNRGVNKDNRRNYV